jgi:hypothetical protein
MCYDGYLDEDRINSFYCGRRGAMIIQKRIEYITIVIRNQWNVNTRYVEDFKIKESNQDLPCTTITISPFTALLLK